MLPMHTTYMHLIKSYTMLSHIIIYDILTTRNMANVLVDYIYTDNNYQVCDAVTGFFKIKYIIFDI